MKSTGPLIPLLLLLSWPLFLAGFVSSQKPSVVKIGAIFTYDSVIGRAAKAAMEAAVSDVNADPTILRGTELRLVMQDANCSVFMGSVETFQVIEQQVVAILGPQSSAIAHMISSIATNLHIPLISFAATDPTLSALQFPFFVRTAQSDSHQMAALADLIDFYEWKEIIAIYVDDDYGRNGISALGDELEKKLIKISYRLPLSVQVGSVEITRMLNESKLFGPRVYVVHINPDPSLRIYKIAQELNMMTSGFVWFATDWLSATIDSMSPIGQTTFEMLQGTVSLRQYTPESAGKKAFLARWDVMRRKGLVSSVLNSYGLCAYDSVWVVARALDRYVKEEGNMTFAFSHALYNLDKSRIQFGDLKVFTGGAPLLKKLLQVNFTGLTGRVRFNSDRGIVNGGYEVINIDEKAVRSVGFWSMLSGFSVSPPSLAISGDQDKYSRQDQELREVKWPGGNTIKPRGWVIADNERPLRIGVPNRFSFRDFVMQNESHETQGYCIDVFTEACKLIPYDVPYKFVPFGDGTFNPSYDELIKMVEDDVFDAAVGDIAIVTNRTRTVDFSQPYASTGLVIVAPIDDEKASAWVFLKPFTTEMWCVTAASFVMIAVVIWFLEHRVNKDFRGPPMRQLVTIFLFSFSTLFKKNQEDTVSPLGKMIMVLWLFLLMVITSSYTASLTSILTIQQLSSPITGIDSLITSDWPIGYQVGSFAYSYLANSLYITRSRLVPLGSPEEYERALRLGPKNGGVAAIVDELPYVELFLSKQTEFGIIGQSFTRGGWGFAFQRGSPLAVDVSTAILKLSESGKLQEINERWFCKMGCPDERRRSSEATQLQLISFWGLYLLCGGSALVALMVFLLRVVRSYVQYKRRQQVAPSSLPSVSPVIRCTEVVHSFFDFIDQKEEAIKRAVLSKVENHHQQPQSR
ncbi:glutamate receptor 3.7 [Punica granatum]|uniref:Glutamate receptor n=2 Tax=Punica granatum TaxID=22663 RepID=A0A218X0R4_PUNGR|nr:glutamate receptor 3.7 [Punica granatum]OWM78564.1 hypothetical protein CDL15_Pgr002731 [Punica granatum]PKI68595.1 hypothetical protein CRG98_010999 [Punica granatum]